jgi:Ulp1 family protease
MIYPVNEDNLHWWVTFVCRASEGMKDDCLTKVDEDGPRIVCMDSAFEPPPKGPHMEMLKGYLRRELFGHPPEKCDGSDPAELKKQVARWKASVVASERMRICIAESPKQQNVFDCGVFVIEFLLHLFREPDRLLTLGLSSHVDWFDQHAVSHRRRRLREIVVMLQRAAVQGSKEADVTVLLKNPDLRAAVTDALLDLPAAIPEQAPVNPGELYDPFAEEEAPSAPWKRARMS